MLGGDRRGGRRIGRGLPVLILLVLAAAAAPALAHTTAQRSSAVRATFDATGTWVDVFDFNPAHSSGRPRVLPADVDRMADAGARTLFIQAARSRDPKAPGNLVSPDLLAQFTVRAHARGMRVVGWYLPDFVNVDDDLRRLRAMLAFSAGGRPFDAIGLDIESRVVADPAVRSARLVDLSRRLRTAAAGRPLAAIVLPPVLLDVVNRNFWPNFPWAGIRSSFDAWVPMSYWTNRTVASGLRDAHRNTNEDVRRLRAYVGRSPIHVVGGIANLSVAADYRGFTSALRESGVVGRSVYDWAAGGAASVAAIRR